MYSASVYTVLACAISIQLMSNPVIGSSECIESDLPLLCHGARLTRSVANMKPVKLMNGVEIVRMSDSNSGNYAEDTKSRSATGFAYADRVLQYLQSHEIKINLHEVLQKSGVTDSVARAMKEIESENEVVGMWLFFKRYHINTKYCLVYFLLV